MKELSRRAFLKNATIGGAVLAFGNAVFHTPLEALADGKHDIGQCKSIRIKCISELRYHDRKKHISAMFAGGGPNTSQYEIPWPPDNGAGNCALIDMEMSDGRHVKFLLDAGWNREYMDTCFKREGVDKMLEKREIDLLVFSHEHMDHFAGIESVLKYNPKIKIIIPSTFNPQGERLIKCARFKASDIGNTVKHEGELIKTKPGTVNKLFDGCAAATFDMNVALGVQGEQSLYFNLKDKGIVCVSGCCHQGILNSVEYVRKNIVGGDKIYGIYGGLHIAPVEGRFRLNWEKTVKGMAKYDFKKIACNHCTGLVAVEKMIEMGFPVVRGTGRFGSLSDLYVGNGDEVVFG
ncbi:twin-arginine translocation signal domain-containing protein [Desulfococcaceae bacterium HSG7]|nr:twin-arginine translocation signal domain-containing protein [Desulfococcaceae bacterium HSG7]